MKAVCRSRKDAARFVDRVCEVLGEKFEKPHTFEAKQFRRQRTTGQNAKIHAMMREIAIHVGHSPEEIKEYIKAEFSPTKEIRIGHDIRTVPRGSSEWDVGTCHMIIEHLYRIGAEAGVVWQESEGD